MSEAGEATSTTTTTLPQAPAEAAAAALQDPAPKSPVGSGAPQAVAPAPAALVAGNPGGDAAPAATGTAAPASSATAGSEDAEKKVLGESAWDGRCSSKWGGRRPAPEHEWAAPAEFPPSQERLTTPGPLAPVQVAAGSPLCRRCQVSAPRRALRSTRPFAPPS